MDRQENTEGRIVEAARRMFVEHGYQKTSMSEIAVAAGINRPTLHYYFRTKDKMFDAVFTQLIQAFMPRIELITAEEISLGEKIEKITDEYIDVYRVNPHLPRFILGEMQRDPDHLLTVAKKLHIDLLLAAVQRMLDVEADRGNARRVPARLTLMTFFGQLTFPFLAQNVVMRSCVEHGEGFDEFLKEWRDNVVSQMKMLLIV